MNIFRLILIATLIGAFVPMISQSAEKESAKKVLYFTKSAGFEHSVVKREGDQFSHSERILKDAFACAGVEVVCSKDGGLISEESLKDFDTVILYTSGNLLEKGTDGQPAISEEGVKALFEWVKNGGGLIGVHAATDSLRGEEPTEYTKMIGGAFLTHGKQEYANVRVVDPEFPAMKGLPVEFRMIDEWYLHNQINAAGNMHVLAVLESGKMEQEMYNKSETVPVMWASSYGKGRVFYTALGHREDVWEMPLFQGILVQAHKWTSGQLEGDPKPNFKDFFK
ncbi:MAG: ThuA domain-containing protein [Candidatus Omnitrophica bacterium]|nr:ThuA domain-containing protein [Candidatus Omnitrophota bacterium]